MMSRESRARLLAPSFLIVAVVGASCGEPDDDDCGAGCNPPWIPISEGGAAAEDGGASTDGGGTGNATNAGGSTNVGGSTVGRPGCEKPAPRVIDCPDEIPLTGEHCVVGYSYRYPERCDYRRDCGVVVATCRSDGAWLVDDCFTCPDVQPADGQACETPELRCAYGEEPCRSEVRCMGDTWVDYTATCNPPELLPCPEEIPEAGVRCDDEPFTEYPEECAYQVPGCGERFAVCDAPSGMWEVCGTCTEGAGGGVGGAAGGVGGGAGASEGGAGGGAGGGGS